MDEFQNAQPGGGKPVEATFLKSYKDIDDETLASIPGNLADQSRTFQNAAKELEHSGGKGAGSTPSDRLEEGTLAAWAAKNHALIPAEH